MQKYIVPTYHLGYGKSIATHTHTQDKTYKSDDYSLFTFELCKKSGTRSRVGQLPEHFLWIKRTIKAQLTVVGECFEKAVQTALHAVSGAVCRR